MQAFREMVRGWLGKTLLGLLLIPFALVGIESYFNPSADPVVATVDGEEITKSLLDKAFENQKQQAQARLGADAVLSADQLATLRERVLNSLVQRELLLASAKASGYRVSDAVVQKLIRETPTFQEAGKFSESRYIQVLSQIGETPATFPARAQSEILSAQRVAGLLQSAFVTEAEVSALVALDAQRRDADVVAVPASRHLADVTVTPAEIQAYHAKDDARFIQPEQVVISYVQLDRARFLATATVTPEALKARYAERAKASASGEERQASHILIAVADKSQDGAARQRIDALAAQLAKGADFAALAKANSQDPGSAINGGDLGFAGRGLFVPEFEKALFALAKPGDVSPVVKSPFGYHLIKLTNIKQPAIPSFESLKPSLEAEVRQISADEQYGQLVEKLDAAFYEASDLKGVATREGLTVQTSPLIARQGAAGVLAERKVLEAAFNEELIKERKNSSAIALRDGSTVWLHVEQHQAERKRPLAEVSGVITDQLRHDKAVAKALVDAQALAKEATGQSLAAMAARRGLSVVSLKEVARRGSTLDDQLQPLIFKAPRPVGATLQPTAFKTDDGAVVLAVSAVKSGPALPVEQRNAMRGMLSQNRGQQELQDVIGLLREQASVKRVEAPAKP